jgi:hypothetical protein
VKREAEAHLNATMYLDVQHSRRQNATLGGEKGLGAIIRNAQSILFDIAGMKIGEFRALEICDLPLRFSLLSEEGILGSDARGDR